MRPLVWFTLTALAFPIFGWGPEGHGLVARIAESQLTPEVRARVVEILGPGKTIVSVASWADEVRPSRKETGHWHFVDIPIGQSHLNMERDCGKGDCIISAIAHFRQALRDPATSADQRREALMFVIHFIGDMHQPLHCSDDHDKGGNTIQVSFHEKRSNLHSIWDSGLLGRLGAADDLFPSLSGESLRRHKKWSRGTVTAWAEQSHRAARKVVYGKLPERTEGTPIVIDAGYETVAAPVIREQIERAGARLASVLNEDLR